MTRAPSAHYFGNVLLVLLLTAGVMMWGAGCGTPPNIVRQDPEIERHVALARGAFASGSADKAAVYYRQALNRARLMDDPAAIGRNAYNLAACLAMLRQHDEARALLDEAEWEFRRAGINAREINLLRARLAHREGDTGAALALVQAQLRALPSTDPFRLQYQLLLADLLRAQGDAAGAAAALAGVNPKSLGEADLAVQADAAMIRGHLALLEKRPRDAGGFMDTAAGHLQQAGQYIEMALALDEAGRSYETAGDTDAAVNRYYRAARSLFFAGQTDRAQRVMTRAALLAGQSGQTAAQARLKQLQTDMNAARNTADRKQLH